MSRIRKILASNVLRLRKNERNWTRQELADMIGKTHQTIYDIENERIWPGDDTIESLAKAFKVSPSSLFEK
jgi:transcriptional regulator with XRE-family HTH domain